MFYSKYEELFWQLYNAKNETDIDRLIDERPDIFEQSNWHPLGEIKNNIGVVKNQQSNPVAALVEKLTNSIDAILMRKCYEAGIDPKSPDAPRSIDDAIDRFFPEHKNWDLTGPRSEQARSIQILADGSRNDTSIIIYDDGEGQHPEDFEDTFLSLLHSNKNEIHFVQGKYNMGGTGAIAFCGKKRYQLIVSKRYDGKGKLGFTLIRRHPLSHDEAGKFKNPWYEYLKMDGQIPAFDIQEIDLGLHNHYFRTGTIVKLYSYDVADNPLFLRHMAQSLNEFLYEPALPITIIESKERYDLKQRGQANVIFGLKRRLENSDYVDTSFSERITDKRFGKTKVSVYVFKARAKDKNLKKTKDTIRNAYFRNRMQVLFSVNGQVHGHYTLEFISRTLQFNLLKHYLLIHVDCTDMNPEFRDELFMASRDRLKQSEESSYLRQKLGESLKNGRLRDIYKQRKDRLSLEAIDDDSMLKQIAENLPINKELQDLIRQAFELDEKGGKKKKRKPSKRESESSQDPFNPKRFPSFFDIDIKNSGSAPVIKIPRGNDKTVQFNSDVENQYFDRTDDPGDMEIGIMTYIPNDAKGGDQRGTVNDISDIFSVSRKSPQDGKIKVVFKPTDEVQVGDEVEIRADLTSPNAPNGVFSQMFWIKVTEPPPKKKKPNNLPEEDEKLGRPRHRLVFEQADDDQQNILTWEWAEENMIEMDHAVVMYPFVEGDVLDTIYINMDSKILKDFKAKKRSLSEEQNQLANRHYIASVYYHTLFLYVINKKKNYSIVQMNGDGRGEEHVDLAEYLKDMFQSYYAEFLLNFEISELMEGLG